MQHDVQEDMASKPLLHRWSLQQQFIERSQLRFDVSRALCLLGCLLCELRLVIIIVIRASATTIIISRVLEDMLHRTTITF